MHYFQAAIARVGDRSEHRCCVRVDRGISTPTSPSEPDVKLSLHPAP
ncbi:MAG: hypothetical protein WCD53_02680 [Microcoleus sp.]